ncbi:hypothetical protein GGI35DRAFT_238073 [Trichoderma velutinum]
MASKGDQTILVTGANSFIAGHIIAQALAKGYKVSGTVRSEEAANKVRKTFDKYQSQLLISIVADIEKPEPYESAFVSTSTAVTAVIHTASPFTLVIKDNVTDLLNPAIKGSTAILKAAKLYGGNVRHVVSTSSFASVVDLAQGLRPGYTYTDKDWAPFTYESAKDADIFTAYGASKTLAEKAMWEFIEKEKVAFTLTTIHPPWVFGPHQGGPPHLANLNVSTGMLWRLVDSPEVPLPDIPICADVRDVAAAHIAAIEKADAAGKRFLIGNKFTYQDAVDIARETIPSLRDRLPKGTRGAGKELESYTLDKTQVEGLLGRALTPVATTITDTLTQLLEAK